MKFTQAINEIIKKEKGLYVLYSHDGTTKLGSAKTRKDILKRERQVEYFKHLNESNHSLNQEYLYHATYKPLLPSIKKNGLNSSIAKKSWPDSKTGVIYLAKDPHVAESYAETSDYVDEDWLDEIIVLKIQISKLDQSKLKKDENVRNDSNDTLEYHGIIPFDAIGDK